MQANAVLLNGPQDLTVERLTLIDPGPGDLVVKIHHSGISTGTEKLFYTGDMPPFPGMGYPLVPGYEASGEVVEAGVMTGFNVGDHVFVPGANCFADARGLFGGASDLLVTDSARVAQIDPAMGPTGALLALAATARHAMTGDNKTPPDLIVGHGVLGRLLARVAIAIGAPPPTVWEIDPARRRGAVGYNVTDPVIDDFSKYKSIYDASGQVSVLNDLVRCMAKGGEIVLAGFYPEPINFAFPPAFMKEARFRVSAEWQPTDLVATRVMIDRGTLSLDDLITHQSSPSDAPDAYRTAFTDAGCLKMILNWERPS